jgi:spore coat polysaccharide biosynthesis protein SpsF
MAEMTGVLAVLQARSSSTRLPGKVLASISGEPMIVRQLERIQRARTIHQVVVATSVDSSDDLLAWEVERRGFQVRRGSLADVLARFVMVAKEFDPSNVVRLTADCPLTDPEVIDQVVQRHLTSGADYTSNTIRRTFPHGLDVEIFRAETLRRIANRAPSDDEREHVTLGMYSRGSGFSLHSVTQAVNLARLRWTVDYPADLEFARVIYDALFPTNPAFSTAEVLGYLREKPHLNRTDIDVG